jgi:hypothetical protein
VSNVQLCYSNGVDLVRGFRHSALDSLLVIVGKDRGHDDSVSGRQTESRYELCWNSRSRAPVARGLRSRPRRQSCFKSMTGVQQPNKRLHNVLYVGVLL